MMLLSPTRDLFSVKRIVSSLNSTGKVEYHEEASIYIN